MTLTTGSEYLAETMARISIFFLILAVAFCAADKTPVLIWSSDRPMSDLPQSYTGQTVDTKSFHKNYLEPLSTKPGQHLVIFLQDQLSAEDFTKYADVYNPESDGGSFKNVKSAMDDQFSVHLPSVSSPKSAIETLTDSFPGKVVKVDNPDDISTVKLGKDKNYIIIVSLNAKHQDMSKKFQEDDATVGRCMHQLQKRGVQFTAMYTAKASSKASSDTEYAGRHLLADVDADVDTNSTGAFESTADVMVYLTNVNISVGVEKDVKYVVFTNFSLTTDIIDEGKNSTVNSTVISVDMDLTSDNGTAKISMMLETTYAQEWKSVNETVTFDMTSAAANYSFEDVAMSFGIIAPKTFSYHCTQLRPRIVNSTTIAKGTTVKITLNGFQIEAFNNFTNDARNGTLRFTDNVWDCVVFFTPPIWMGIITTIVLVLILFYAVTMIANITTMDRFDDPKGKAITVTVNE